MAMISCPECKKSISDQAASCPECGHPISDRQAASTSSRSGSPMAMIALGAVALVAVGGIGLFLMQPKGPAENPPASQQSAPPATDKQAAAESKTPASAPPASQDTAEGDKFVAQYGLLDSSGDMAAVKQALPVMHEAICGAAKGECKIHNIRAYQDYVWFSWTDGNAGGTAVGTRSGGSWKLLKSAGGVMYPQNAVEYGVPLDIAEFVVPVSWDGSTDTLQATELESLSQWQLLIIRNTIYAHHGREFTTPRLKEYFATWSWYKPNPGFNENMLTALEKKNVETVLQVEKQKGYM